ncbi:MAG: pyridoxamine 5'-phosphate oxidase family protein [Anaerolineae bacterium]|nr:pyridoxamine 5'-phosphate oxidase family protein [Anaerolineae bacterium]
MSQSMTAPTEYVHRRLREEKIVWVATVRPNGAPHLTPVWFVWDGRSPYICIKPTSRKAHNLRTNPHIALSLEDGSNVVIIEGTARPATPEEREQAAGLFKQKYDWDIRMDTEYTLLIRIVPQKFLTWGNEDQG